MDFRLIQAVLFLLDSFDTIASSQNNVRLVGGSNPKRGRVEILHDGEWGTICTNSWDDQDARVVCRELGLGMTGEAVADVSGGGDGRIWLDNVRCTGFESRLGECVSDGWGIQRCGRGHDAAVRCRNFVRLAGNKDSANEGRVEVFYDGEWGTVCGDFWGEQDATVVCRELGLGNSGEAVRDGRFDEGRGRIWLDNVYCTGDESSLYMCRRQNNWGDHNCDHDDDAGVICGDFVRVVNSPNRGEGRVEVFHDSEWGTVCDDGWDDADATVVCRELGLGDYGEAVSEASFGEGDGPIWMDDVACIGLESTLYVCRARSWGSNDCNHNEDAGVKCYRYIAAPTQTPSDTTDYDPQTGDVAAPTVKSRETTEYDSQTAATINHPVLYVVIALMAVTVICLVVYIVILRREMKDRDKNETGRFRSFYDCLASPIRDVLARKRNPSEKKIISPIQGGKANQNDSTRGQSEDQGEVYNAAYEIDGANYGEQASAKSDEEGAHVYNCVDENNREDIDCPSKTGVDNTSGSRDGGPQAEDVIHDGNSVRGSSGDNDSYQYVEY